MRKRPFGNGREAQIGASHRHRCAIPSARTIVTSDNPRSEDPARIIEEVKLGIQTADRQPGTFFAIVDRGEAIEQAIGMAEPGDLVLLAGKGHEKTQVIGNQELPFDEVEIARAALDRRRARLLCLSG